MESFSKEPHDFPEFTVLEQWSNKDFTWERHFYVVLNDCFHRMYSFDLSKNDWVDRTAYASSSNHVSKEVIYEGSWSIVEHGIIDKESNKDFLEHCEECPWRADLI